MEIWKKNLYVVFFAEMIVVTGIAFVIPFLPFYVKELGITNTEQAARWSGWLMGAPALAMIIVSPIWGSLADTGKHQRDTQYNHQFKPAKSRVLLSSLFGSAERTGRSKSRVGEN